MVRVLSSRWGSHLTHVINVCCGIGYFPSAWKLDRIVIIPKKADNRGVVVWRPLTILSNLAKVMEYALMGSLAAAVAPLPNQYGFRRGVGTVEAVERLLKLWEEAKKSNRHYAVVSLDVRNAFNAVRWANILQSLRRHSIPLPLFKVIVSYLQDRAICFFQLSWLSR